jgi:hypothetical protein
MRAPVIATALAASLLAAGAATAQPAGSYAATCINAHQDAPTRLVADCPDRHGRYVRTVLDWRACQGDIVNIDGRLDCAAAPPVIAAPPTTGTTTVIQYRDRPPAPIYTPLPATITLHSRPGFGGTVATFDGPVADLRQLGFSGYAESVAVSGPATWEVCSAPGFGGRCAVVAGNVADMTQAGLAGPVWSIRPLN